MGATSAYCNECYNKAAKSGLPEDAPIQAAGACRERADD